MAKPKPPSFALASTATSSSSHARECASSSTRRRAQNNLSPRPSSNLIALLATVAASSSADGRPLSPDSGPPDFLCPYLSSRFGSDRPSSSRRTLAELTEEEEEQDFYAYAVTPTRVRRVGAVGQNVPDKYVQGDDGRWRKEDSWTLYGSTYCNCATDESQNPATTTRIPEVDDQADPTLVVSATASASAQPTSSSTSSDDMTATLPQGWNRPGKNDDVARYIPILAVFLAIFICVLIFGCVSWRRKRRGAARDLEKKPRKQCIPDDDSESELDDKQRARAQQRRLWAKTTARWKPNLKIAARRRRKRTTTMSSTSGTVYPSSPRASFADAAGSSETLHEDIPSSPSAVQVDSDSVHPALSSPDLQLLDGETPRPGEPQVLPDSHSHEEEPALPPDYRDGTSSQGDNPAERLPSAGGALLTAHATPTFSSDNHVSTAHIATDDKNLLARMASLVSAPPVDDPPTVDDPSHEAGFGAGPSVPVIEELEAAPVAELEAMGSSSEKGPAVVWSNNLCPSSSSTLRPSLAATLPVPTYSREPSPQPPLFPAPPSKAQLAAPAFYEYPSTFESDALDDYHSSAPPFGPSAPEHDSDGVLDAVPCAPPLIDEEDELHLGLGPSAPPLPPEEGEIPGADAGPMPASVSVPRRAHTSSSRQRERTFLSPPDYLP